MSALINWNKTGFITIVGMVDGSVKEWLGKIRKSQMEDVIELF